MRNRWSAQGDLAIEVVAPQDGLWQPVEGLWPVTVVVGGTFPDETVLAAELLVCCQRRRPDDSENGWPSIYMFTERRVFTLDQPVWWIKLRVTSFSPESGSMSANYQAAGQGG
jgi:hypothetical protein